MLRLLILSTLVGLVACGGGGGSSDEGAGNNVGGQAPGPAPGAPIAGVDVYMQPQPGGNVYTCSTCHALTEPTADGIRRPGHPIGDALRRPDYKNGQLPSFLAAANTCLEDWMAVSTPWTETSPAFVALNEYLESQDMESGIAEPVRFQILSDDVPNTGTAGDIARGKTAFNSTCVVCHGEDADGGDKGPRLSGTLRSDKLITRRVRTSGSASSPIYTGLTGGRMPFWSAERLSDQELVDIIAFLEDRAEAPIAGGGGSSSGGGNSDCASTHPSIGKTAMLSTLSHDVSGTATIIDDCTIELSAFNYDGGGITVYLYGGLNGNYSDKNNGPGILMGQDLVRATPYVNETLQFKLPAGKTLNDLDGVSVWCSDIDISFGDGLFN